MRLPRPTRMYFALLLMPSLPAVGQLCPPCYNNQAPLPGHGAFSSSDNRRVLYVKVDTTTWGSPPPTNITAGTDQAVGLWNGVQTCYHFQVITSAVPDFLIASKPSVNGGCAEDVISSYPYKINIANGLQSKPSSQLGSIISHELGHGIGLDNADNGCEVNATVMSGQRYGTGCVMITGGPTAVDVAKSNLNCTNRLQCERSQPVSPALPTATSCPLTTASFCSQQFANSRGPVDSCAQPGPALGCPSGAVRNGSCCVPGTTPIILDLDDSGFTLTDAQHGVEFDFEGNGRKQRSSWTSQGSNNAWLWLDRNGNGTVDSGLELFGNYTPQHPSDHPNGFAALAEFDKAENGGNGDGWITREDRVYSQLRLWRDINHDGVSQPQESLGLDKAGISGISLSYSDSNWVDMYGNQFRFRGLIRKSSGGTHVGKWAYDVILVFSDAP